MAILYPIAIPLTWAVAMGADWDIETAHSLLFNVISIVLAASVLGDHCSPISDTTILSSLASDCNHIDHVRTQLPYALTVGAVSITASFLATVLGGGWVLCLALMVASMGVLYGIVRWRGVVVDA
jgi:Na+/H+ antiporter NhaC